MSRILWQNSWLALCVATTLAPHAAAQQPKPGQGKNPSPTMALIVVENLWNKEGLCDRRQLVRYRFKEGHLLPKEVLLTKDQFFFGHFGGHKIVADRFVVTRSGAVIDLRTKKVIHDETLGDLVAADEKRVLFRINNVNRESGLFAFDMQTHKVTKVRDTGLWGPGTSAPDKKRIALMDTHGELWIKTLDGKKRRLAKGFLASLSMLSSGAFPTAPVFWIDNQTLLTQNRNGQLVTVNMKGKITRFTDIDNVPEPISAPRIERDPGDRLIYHCSSFYVIDLEKRSATKTRWRAMGHGFDCEINRSKEYGSIVRERGKEIGRWFCLPWGAVTAPDHLAIPFARPKALGYPIGIKIWDAPRRQWRSLRISVNCLVGWVRLTK